MSESDWEDITDESDWEPIAPGSSMSWGQAVKQGAKNFIPQTAEAIKNTAKAVINPMSVVDPLSDMLVAGISKVVPESWVKQTPEAQQKFQQYSNLGDLLGERAKGVYNEATSQPEQFAKKMIAEHPVDIAMLLSGGLGLGQRASLAGGLPKTAKYLGKASEFTDPFQLAGKAVGLAATPFKKALGVNKQITPEVVANLKLREETGIDFSPASITQKKEMAQVESFLDKNIASSNVAQKSYQKNLVQTEDFARKLQEGMGGKKGMLEAGESVQQAAKGRYAQFMNKAQELYNNIPIDKNLPIETNNLKDIAIGHLDEIGKMGPNVKSILNIAKESVEPSTTFKPGTIISSQGQPLTGGNMPTYSWSQLLNDRSTLGKMWKQTSDHNKKRVLKDLIDAIDDDILAFSDKNKVPEIANSFLAAKTFYREGGEGLPGVPTFRDRQIANVLQTTSPEDIVNKFIKPNNVSDVSRLMAASGNEGKAVVKQAWLEKLLSKGEEQSFSPARFATAFDKYDKETLRAFLSKEELDGLEKLAKSSRMIDKAERIAGNPSGTAPNLMTGWMFWNMVKHPIMTALLTLGTNRFAKLYFENPSFRRKLIEGLNTETSQGMKYAGTVKELGKQLPKKSVYFANEGAKQTTPLLGQ